MELYTTAGEVARHCPTATATDLIEGNYAAADIPLPDDPDEIQVTLYGDDDSGVYTEMCIGHGQGTFTEIDPIPFGAFD